jgi:hypothetical protein
MVVGGYPVNLVVGFRRWERDRRWVNDEGVALGGLEGAPVSNPGHNGGNLMNRGGCELRGGCGHGEGYISRAPWRHGGPTSSGSGELKSTTVR